MGYPVTVFEKEKRPGGMLMNGIPSFRLEKDVINAEIDVLREMGVEFKCGVEVGEDITIAQLREQGYKAFYIAIGKVTAVVFKKCISVLDENKRFSPKYDEEELLTVPCDQVLLSIGQSIKWGTLLEGTRVEFNPNGTLKADPVTYQTAEPDIFTGGDNYTGPRFAIDAIAAGKEGCVSIHRFVHEGQSLTLGRNRRQFIELDKDNIKVDL